MDDDLSPPVGEPSVSVLPESVPEAKDISGSVLGTLTVRSAVFSSGAFGEDAWLDGGSAAAGEEGSLAGL